MVSGSEVPDRFAKMKSIPHLTVVVLVFICRDDVLLLVKQSYGKQYWSLPGGVVELGESLEQAAIREVKEETGLDVRLRRVVGLYSKPDENSLAVTFEGEAIGGTLMPTLEISECRFFPLHQLPEARDHLRQRVDDFLSASPYAVLRTQ
jgi:8-oxo-dGTP diphosphatase